MPLQFQRHILSNGLRLIVHEDPSTPLASCNVVYRVGSRDENPDMTGMAHLFEHFMFTGSKNIADFDAQLQSVGAINNAYTTQDITHYYITLPAVNIEHALWLESDRMMELAFQQEKLDIQKHVVIEEFKENFLNRPYGDMWLLYNQFYFQKHPYQWLPIGKEISHIEKVSMEDMKNFFYRFYRPNNAVLTISGNVKFEEIVPLVEKWFGQIPTGPVSSVETFHETSLQDLRENQNTQEKDGLSQRKTYPQEDLPTEHRMYEVKRNVPADMLFKGWPTCGRLDADFYAYDMLSDLFGSGQSSYLYKKFVMEDAVFTDISAYITGTLDPGVFIIGGRPAEGVSIEEADQKLNDFIYQLPENSISSHDLQKVKNRVESIILQNDIKIEDRSSSLAVAECFSCAEDFNDETQRYFAVTEEQINTLCHKMFRQEQEATMYYKCAN
ncbi:MAG: insulinase family protein [Bacteroidales bacterium]|nr:insulinase family protein [Bacteroidales bacterium]